MTIQEIKNEVDNGKTVHWSNNAYRVIKDKNCEYLIHCDLNGFTIGLTNRSETILNGNPEEFYVKD